jgi:hypothetical protein
MAYNPQPPLGQDTMAKSLPVAIANNQTNVPVSGTVTANISGSINNTSFIATQGTATNLKTQAENYVNGNPVSSSNPLFVQNAGTILALSGNLGNTLTTLVQGNANGYTVYGWYMYNNSSTVPLYVQFFNATGGTLGTTQPYYSIAIPPSSGANVFGPGIYHASAIAIAVTSTRNGNGSGGTIDYNIFYKLN